MLLTREDVLQEMFNNADLIEYMNEFKISQAMMDESIQLLRDWFKLQPHLPNIELEHEYLVRVLCFNKFSIEKSKTRIDNLFKAQTLVPEFFDNPDVTSNEIQQSRQATQWTVMFKITANKERLIILRYLSADTKLYCPYTAFKYIYMAAKVRMFYETCFKDRYIWDCSNMKLGHVFKHTPSFVKNCTFILEKCFGFRVQGFHLINIPSYANAAAKMLKSALSDKLAQRFLTHDTLEDLHLYIPKSELPKEFGGDLESCECLSENLQLIMNHEECRDIFSRLEKYKSDESRRQQESKEHVDDPLGITGSFRKLVID